MGPPVHDPAQTNRPGLRNLTDQDIIRQTTGITPQLFRPPYIDTNDALRSVERQYGLTEINADVDSQDWNNATVDQIVANARGLQAGGVILMHDWLANTILAIPQIVTELRTRGLCPGMISPVIGRAVAPDSTTPPTTTPPSTTPSSTPQSPKPSGSSGTCTAAYRTASSWTGGFQGEVTVTNSGNTTINSWKVTMNMPAGAAIGSIRNGVNTGTTATVTVTNASYNGVLGAGKSTTFGFVASGSSSGLILLRRVVAFEAFESFAVVGVSGLVLASAAERGPGQ